MDKILELEKRIHENREILNELIKEETNNEIIKDKILFLESEIKHLNNQLILIKQQHGMINTYTQVNQPVKQTVPKPIKKSVKTNLGEIKVNSFDFEKLLGKSGMSIFASILIFISIVLFGTLLIPKLGEVFQIGLMFAVSGLIAGFGLWKLNKSEEFEKLYTAIASCGLGGIYISLLITYFHFEAISDIALLGCIFVWIFAICTISKFNNVVFNIIQQIGLTISVILSCTLCSETNDAGRFLMFVGLFIVTNIVLYALIFKRNNEHKLEVKINNIFQTINLLVLSICCRDLLEPVFNENYCSMLELDTFTEYIKPIDSPIIIISAIALIIYMISTIVANYLLKQENIISTLAQCSVYGYVLILIDGLTGLLPFVDTPITNGDICTIISNILLMGIFFINDRLDKNKICLIIKQAIVTFMILSVIEYYLEFLLIFILIIGIYNYFKEKDISITLAYNFILLTLIGFFISNGAAIGIYSIAIPVLIGLWYLGKTYYNKIYEIILYVLTLAYISDWSYILIQFIEDKQIFTAEYIDFELGFILVAILNVIFVGLYQLREHKEKINEIAFGIINAMLMFTAIYEINCFYIESAVFGYFELFLYICCAVGLFTVNTKRLIENYNTLAAGFYIGIKYTILLYTILMALDTSNIIVSIGFIVFAILAIIIGFINEYKWIRLYGLILSMISVFKLIMIDITYDNTLENAIGFFICGVLCFGISYVYTKVEKQFNNQLIENDLEDV